MEEYEKKHDHAVSEKETDIPKLTDLLLKVGTQQFLETLSPYITGGEILFDGDDGQTWKFTFDPENKSWQQKCGTESFTDQMMIHELEQKGYEIRKEGGTVINKKAGKSCGKRKIVQISNASSELIKATIQEKHMSYRGLAKHLRAAHWHTYLYGPSKKLRKVLWVAATWVGAGDEEIDVIHTTT